jgi:hypothetical protein
VKGADLSGVVESDFYVNGKLFRRDFKRPFVRKLPFGKLRHKHHAKTRALVSLVDGRQLTIDRNLRACR